jgi:DNA uptake protein ComE-like DNA-binding protein
LDNGKLRTKILSDPYYRFKTAQEVQLAGQLGVKIDANQAGIDDWLRLPGLSIHQARSLVQLTQSGLHFYALDDVAAALGLPVGRLQPWLAVLQFCYYDLDSAAAGQLNPNTATVEDWLKFPEIDAALAHRIVRDRIQLGRFANLADLQQRLSLPTDLLRNLLHRLRF